MLGTCTGLHFLSQVPAEDTGTLIHTQRATAIRKHAQVCTDSEQQSRDSPPTAVSSPTTFGFLLDDSGEVEERGASQSHGDRTWKEGSKCVRLYSKRSGNPIIFHVFVFLLEISCLLLRCLLSAGFRQCEQERHGPCFPGAYSSGDGQ